MIVNAWTAIKYWCPEGTLRQVVGRIRLAARPERPTSWITSVLRFDPVKPSSWETRRSRPPHREPTTGLATSRSGCKGGAGAGNSPSSDTESGFTTAFDRP